MPASIAAPPPTMVEHPPADPGPAIATHQAARDLALALVRSLPGTSQAALSNAVSTGAALSVRIELAPRAAVAVWLDDILLGEVTLSETH